MMDRRIHIRLRYFGVMCGAMTMILFFGGFAGMARWVPPLDPALTADAVAQHYSDNSVSIRVGMVMVLFGATAYLPWTMVLTEYVRKVEGKSIFRSGLQFAGGVMSQLTFFIPSFLWAVAAYRPERDAMVVQGISDIGWLLFITATPPFMLQYSTLAIAIFADKRANPGFPRWAAYLQILIALSFVPASLALFFKAGPFAWNGIFVWWIPLTVFFAWFLVMTILAWRMVTRESRTDCHWPVSE